MPYLVGDMTKETTAGGPVPSFPKSFKGPPKLEKEKDALALDEKKSQLAQENQAAKVQEEIAEDWVKEKWAWYYEPNNMGEMKPNFSKMNAPQFEQYMKDAQAQGRHRTTAASRHLGVRQQLVAQPDSKQQQEEEKTVKTEATQTVKIEVTEAAQTKVPPAVSEGPRKRKAFASAAEPQTVSANTQSRPRKKPRVRAHITKEKYLKKH
ncbi:hypothetical protein E8E11_010855 [Didymella keratinophila]|nr:hypothetical protein E8E11_010855 [Didymella keratinophila]